MWRIWIALAASVAAGALWAASPKKGILHDPPARLVPDRVRQIEVGRPQRYGGLTMFPLIARTIGGMDYLTLDEAMDRGAIRVTEKDQEEVNRIVVRNLSGRRVFIMDGEEVVGAKQNRVLNSSVLIPPRQIVVVPVSCVEQGRWTATSEGFKAGGTQLFAKARQANIPAVSSNYSRQPSAGPQSDQADIWRKVAEKRVELKLGAPSGPMHEVYRKREADIGSYTKRFHVVQGQVGALFAIDDEIVGADIFDQNRTLRLLFPKLVKSYALDAIGHRERFRTPPPDAEDALSFLRRVLRPGVSIRAYDSPGEGWDVRIVSDRINGAALVAAGRALHISLFAPEKDVPIPLNHGGIRPPSERRR